MKIFSYTCISDKENEATAWISGMGFTLIGVIYDLSSNDSITVLFYVPDKESETMLRLQYHRDTFQDMSA